MKFLLLTFIQFCSVAVVVVVVVLGFYIRHGVCIHVPIIIIIFVVWLVFIL